MTHVRTPSLETTTAGLQRLYFRTVIAATALTLGIHVLVGLVWVGHVPLPPIHIGTYAVLLVLAALGNELARDPDEPDAEPRGVLFALVGLTLVFLTVLTGGSGSPYFVLLLVTSVFGGLLLVPGRSMLLTALLTGAYCAAQWFEPVAVGLLTYAPATPPATDALRGAELTRLAVQGTYLFGGALIALRLSSRFREQVGRLEKGATRDPLTGLPNRRGFLEKVRLERQRAEQWDWPMAILVVDLDHFKRVNDRFGHPVGDAVLAVAAGLLRDAAGPLDHLARIGGEEFAVAAVGADPRHGADVADRIVRSFRTHDWTQIRTGLTVTCSVGVANVRPDENGDELPALIDRADQALLRVKSDGRDGYALSDAAHGVVRRRPDADPVATGPA